MKKEQRPVVVAIAYSLETKKNVSSVFSFADGKYFNVSCNGASAAMNVYDYNRSCHISVSTNGNRYSLYDYGESCHVDLKINGERFEGYDYGSSNFFNGTIRGNSIEFYDYEVGRYFSYSV